MIDIYKICSEYGISKNEIEGLQIHSAVDILKIYETSLRTRFNEEFKENIKRINKNLISMINSANSINHLNINILNKNIGDNSDALMDRIIQFYKDLGFEVKAPKENRSVNSTMIIEWPEVNIEEIFKPIDNKNEDNSDKFEVENNEPINMIDSIVNNCMKKFYHYMIKTLLSNEKSFIVLSIQNNDKYINKDIENIILNKVTEKIYDEFGEYIKDITKSGDDSKIVLIISW